MKSLSVSFIGAGNLAWHLAPALDNAGYAVREVYSRREKNAFALAEKLYQSEATTSLDFSSSPSQLFLLCVTDDVITEIISDLVLPPDTILAHASGSQPLSILDNARADGKGVFYPLQTFTKSRSVDFNDIPFFIESADPAVEKVLTAMAKALSKKVVSISSQERIALHVAAVFASNFTNHMMTLAKEVLVNNGLDFNYLKPLIAETVNKALAMGPEKSQTGPAKRGDLEILDKQYDFLKSDQPVAEIYKLVSQHILDSYAE